MLSCVRVLLVCFFLSILGSATAAPPPSQSVPHADPMVAAHTSDGAEIRYDLHLNRAEKTKLIFWAAAREMKARLFSSLLVMLFLSWLIVKYGGKLWKLHSDRELSSSAMVVMIALLLPLAYAGNVVAWAKRSALNEIPVPVLAKWKYGTDDLSKIPTYVSASGIIPK